MIARITYAFRRVLSRPPAAAELRVLRRLLEQQRGRIAEGWLSAPELAGSPSGEWADLPAGVTPSTLAAHLAVARTLLNLDETLTKD